MRRILHVVPGLNEGDNGIAVAAKLIAAEQAKSGDEAEVIDTRGFVSSSVQPSTFNLQPLSAYAEIWVHSMWLPMTLKACWKVIRAGAPLVRMTHANLDPLRYHYHGWKKRLVAPIERWLFKRTDRVVVTCEAEKKWCQQWGLKNEFEVLDLKKFFDLDKAKSKSEVEQRNLHVLYLGRRHQLKGVEFLERAVEELKQTFEHSEHSNNRTLELRIVSNAFGVEKEKVWQWCDVLVLPTLSENFGLVVAEALERGKQVITTDGAPAWADLKPEQGIYLKGYRNGTAADRVRLLKDAIESINSIKRSCLIGF